MIYNKFYEYAVHSVANRNRIIEGKNMPKIMQEYGAKAPLFRSVYAYEADVIEYVRNNKKSISSYQGVRDIDEIPVDIDRDKNSDLFTQKKLHKVLDRLNELDVPPDAYQIYFSGTGYHVFLTNKLFGFKPSDDLPYIVNKTMENCGLSEDNAVYRGSQIIRLEHSLNEKSGLYKIPLTLEEARTLKPEEITALAKTQRLDFIYEELTANYELSDYIVSKDKIPDKGRAVNNDVGFNGLYAVCIQRLWSLGAQEGTRNNAILRIASHFKRQGIPQDATTAALIHAWNKKTDEGLDDYQIEKRVSDIYSSAVRYGCSDKMLKLHCRNNCVFYNNKDIEKAKAHSVEDLHNLGKERLEMYRQNNGEIDLKVLMGLPVECKLYPGELVTLIGDTGSNKTSLIQNIVLGYNMITGKVSKYNKSIMLYSPELKGGDMHIRNMCMVSGLSPEELTVEDMEKHKNDVSNISMVLERTDLNGLDTLIRENQPDVLIVDYIKQVADEGWGRSPYNTATKICTELSSMANKYNIVIVLIAHTSRSATADGKPISEHGGADSAAIEMTARRLFTIDKKGENYRVFNCVKSNNGATFKNIVLERQPNWRFKRV